MVKDLDEDLVSEEISENEMDLASDDEVNVDGDMDFLSDEDDDDDDDFDEYDWDDDDDEEDDDDVVEEDDDEDE